MNEIAEKILDKHFIIGAKYNGDNDAEEQLNELKKGNTEIYKHLIDSMEEYENIKSQSKDQ